MLREIAGRPVGAAGPVFVIAEIGLNHSGSLDRALQMVDAAAWAGATAIKLQTLVADQLVAASCPAPAHVRAASLRDFFAVFELTRDAHRAVIARAREHGLAVLSTPFSLDAVQMLDVLGVDALKIASGDLTFDGLITAAAHTRRPVVMSTGMSTMAEISRATAIARAAGTNELAVLHCVSAYPTPAASQNLLAIQTLQRSLALPIGFSDHSVGSAAAIAAVALGACVYERHLVLDDDADAIDRPVSSTPAELKATIELMEQTRIALGNGWKHCQPAEAPNVVPSRRALYATRSLRAGERITAGDVIALRPAAGLPPSALASLIGTVLQRDVTAGAPFLNEDVNAGDATDTGRSQTGSYGRRRTPASGQMKRAS